MPKQDLRFLIFRFVKLSASLLRLLQSPCSYHLLVKGFLIKHFPIYQLEHPTILNEDYEIKVFPTISVIFPTKNGLTNGVVNLIESLRNQSIPIEKIIAYDSGSIDGTKEFLKSVDVEVIVSEEFEFSHSSARNHCIDQIQSDYILFTVDDAEFNDVNWLRKAISTLFFTGAVAGSSKQHSVINDSYSICKTIKHNNFLVNKFSDNSIISIKKEYINLLNIFRTPFVFSPIDNTNNLVKTDVIKSYKFKEKSVEDLDFGSRLLLDGKKIAFFSELSVNHGHSYYANGIDRYAIRVYQDLKIYRDKFEYGPYNTCNNHMIAKLLAMTKASGMQFVDDSDIFDRLNILFSSEINIEDNGFCKFISNLRAFLYFLTIILEFRALKSGKKFFSQRDEQTFKLYFFVTEITKLAVFSTNRLMILRIDNTGMKDW
jgi:glycosyltransferase involved in cell wall biosynthesis